MSNYNKYMLRCIKTSLKSIVSNKINKQINNVVKRCNKIIIHTYQFLKLYILYNKYNIPKIDRNFIMNVIKTVTYNSNKAGRTSSVNKQLLNKLLKFYKVYFVKLIDKQHNRCNLTQIMRFLSTDIITNIVNNIKLNYKKHLTNYVKFLYNRINKTKLKKAIINKMVRFLLNNKKFGGTKLESLFTHLIKKVYMPLCKDKTKSVMYDVVKYPQKYLLSMIMMNTQIEKFNNLLNKSDKVIQHKMYQVLPLRSSIIPKYIPIDTTVLIDILIKNNKADYYKTIKKNKLKLWSRYFKKMYTLPKNKSLITNKKYIFYNMIYTDGYAVSVLQIKKKPIKNNVKKKPMNSIYVDELTKCELEQLKKYNIVGVDPGKRNIIQMVDKYKNKLRYTCMQRRFECGFKHAKQEMKKIKTKRIIKTESVLSYYNSKSCTVKNFVKYIRLKNIINNVLTNFYQKEIFRKLKWRSYIKTQKSIANLINNIKIKFKKDDKKICLAYGNWSLSKQMRHYLSTPGIGLKNKLSKYFKIITVDEYKTSKICSRCDKELEKFLIRKNPRPYKEEYKTVHSLLRCKNVDCNKLWDRDINASINMIRIIKSHIKNNNRLEILKRTKKKN